jgi:hypothetical protein
MSKEPCKEPKDKNPNEHFPEDSHAPKTETKDMEVHHHSHDHGRRTWKSYFREFLMLFLAVFCGFLAEYQLEHKIERDRAKELAKSFYEELKNDSVVVAEKAQNRLKAENALLYLAKYFKDSSLTNVSKTFALNFLYGLYFRTPSKFEPRTAVLEQLKNSGSLRYFKNGELQKLIGDLSVVIQNINDRQDVENQVRFQYINPLVLRHYDYDFESQITQDNKLDIFTAASQYESSNEAVPFHFKSTEKFDKIEAINLMGFYGRAALAATRRVHYERYIEINAKLLEELGKEYHLR